jgi:hypothetical protein
VRIGPPAVDEFCLTRDLGDGLHFGGREEIFDLKEHRMRLYSMNVGMVRTAARAARGRNELDG